MVSPPNASEHASEEVIWKKNHPCILYTENTFALCLNVWVMWDSPVRHFLYTLHAENYFLLSLPQTNDFSS
jgi:hypothetical protein